MILFLLVGVNECSQDANMNMQYAENIVTKPFHLVADLFSNDTKSAIDDQYQRYQKIQSSISLDQIECETSPSEKTSSNSLVTAGEQVIDSYCACSTWQEVSECEPMPKCCHISCPLNIKCERQCPKNLSILNRNKERCAPQVSEGNFFNFNNSGFDVFPNTVRQASKQDLINQIPSSAYGLGMVSARRKFNELAFFQKGERPVFPNKKEEKKHYLESIDKIFEGKPAKIQGFSNLDEFSADPMVQKYIRQKIADEWLERSVGRGLSEKKADPKAPVSKEKSEALSKIVKSHIGQLGSITLSYGFKGPDSTPSPAQALEIYQVIENKNSKVFCAHDPNQPNTSPPNSPYNKETNTCSPSISLDETGTARYKTKQRKILNPPKIEMKDGIKKIKKYEIITEERELVDLKFDEDGDKKDAIHNIHGLHPFCLEEKKCPIK